MSSPVGRRSMIVCTSVAVRPGSSASTACGAVLTFTRGGSSEALEGVVLSSRIGMYCFWAFGSLSGEAYFVAGWLAWDEVVPPVVGAVDPVPPVAGVDPVAAGMVTVEFTSW